MAEIKNANTLTPEQLKQRAEIEAHRGIVRDSKGRIIRSKEWLKSRKEYLHFKLEDIERRIKKVNAELADIEKKLK